MLKDKSTDVIAIGCINCATIAKKYPTVWNNNNENISLRNDGIRKRIAIKENACRSNTNWNF